MNESPACQAERPCDTQGLVPRDRDGDVGTDCHRCSRCNCEAIQEYIAQVRGDAADRVQGDRTARQGTAADLDLLEASIACEGRHIGVRTIKAVLNDVVVAAD